MMFTFVNTNGDTYSSTKPRHPSDRCVAPRPDADHIFDFETGNWIRDPSLEEPIKIARRSKYCEIITKSNDIKALLNAKFSAIEELTWANQEAAARHILKVEDDCTNYACLIILSNQASLDESVAMVERLAEIDNTSVEDFSARILQNAKLASSIGSVTLFEQRAFETILDSAETIEEIEAVEVVYSALELLENQDG